MHLDVLYRTEQSTERASAFVNSRWIWWYFRTILFLLLIYSPLINSTRTIKRLIVDHFWYYTSYSIPVNSYFTISTAHC